MNTKGNANFTAGPWEVDTWTYTDEKTGTKTQKTVIQNKQDAVAETWHLYRPDDLEQTEQQANARLIASAPDLLEVLKSVSLHLEVDALDNPSTFFPLAAMRGRIARTIAKAEGR